MNKLLLLISLCLQPLLLKAQSTFSTPYTITLNDGASFGLIKALTTDDKGFLWVAIDDGVMQYDGKKTTLYKPFSNELAKAFCRLKNGRLLVLHDNGLSEIISSADKVTFKKIINGSSTVDADHQLYLPKSIYADKNNHLWIGENESIVHYANGRVKKLRFSKADHSGHFMRSFSFAEDKKGTLWAISWNGNLYYYDKHQKVFKRSPITEHLTAVSSMISDIGGDFLIGANEGLFKISPNSGNDITLCKKIAAVNAVSSAIFTDSATIYISTWNNGLYRYNLKLTANNITAVDVKPLKDINSLYLDPKNGLWIADSENIFLLKPLFFKTITLQDNAPAVNFLSLSRDGSILATNEGKLYTVSQYKGKINQSPLLKNSNIYATAALKDGNTIWLGNYQGEIFKSDVNQNHPVKIISTSSGTEITCLFKDADQNIWACGNNNGLIRINPQNKIFYYRNKGLLKSKVLIQAADGHILCAGDDPLSYLFVYDKANDKFIDISVNLPFKSADIFKIEDIALSATHQLLMATSNGLLSYVFRNGFTKGSINRINLKKIAVNEPIKAVASTETGAWWVAAASGLVKYDKHNTLLFNKNSGLPTKNLSKRGLVIDSSNTLWIATSSGLAYGKDEQNQYQQTAPPLIRRLTVNDQALEVIKDPNPSFPYQSSVYVEFASPVYPSGLLGYESRLIGLDTTWTPTQKNEIIYSALPAGEYTLQLRSQQQGKLWSKTYELHFSVKPAWFQRWPAILLFLLIFVALLATFTKIYNWTLVQKNKRLAKIIELRTQEISEHKNKLIESKNEIIKQKEKLIAKNELVFKTEKAIAKVAMENQELLERQLKQQLEYSNKQLTMISLKIIQKNEMLTELKERIEKLIKTSTEHVQTDLTKLLKMIDSSFRIEKDWEEFKLCFEEVNVDFYKNLNNRFAHLTTLEQRHCALIKLNLNLQESAAVLGISAESVKIFRLRLRKKMNMDTPAQLTELLMQL